MIGGYAMRKMEKELKARIRQLEAELAATQQERDKLRSYLYLWQTAYISWGQGSEIAADLFEDATAKTQAALAGGEG